MKKEFSMSNDKVMINFTVKYCNSFESILESNGFRRILEVYLRRSKKKNSLSYRYLNSSLDTDSLIDIRRDLIEAIRYLTVMTAEEVVKINDVYEKLLNDKDQFIEFVEDFYLFWRKLERYTIVHRYKIQEGLAAASFTEANANFSNLILSLYRKIEMHVVAGTKKEVAEGLTIAQLIVDEKVENPDYVTVTVNDDFVDQDQFAATTLKENDSVEFLYFMGGGSF